MHFFWQMREEELWDFVTQEAQSVSAHWCSELAGLSLWSPINSAVRLLPPSPRHTACSYTQPTAAPGNTCLSLPPDLGQTHSTAPLCPHTFFPAMYNPRVNAIPDKQVRKLILVYVKLTFAFRY